MKKADLVNELAKFTSTKKESVMAVEIMLNLIKKTLKKREEVFLSGFGTFSIVKRKARKGRNPKTGEAIRIPARVLPKFKPARAFKEAVK
ncbi:MAG: HU family DNA-binding protein [Prolixibacteraceae bacterium]|jgi:DNA-binding protein HU-beta|nr:HU family DNA-binding protein [Prolixibacteraceae bacterium]